MKSITQISPNQLEPNPLQPRGNIDPESIKDLIESIKQHGILEPLVIAHTPAGYQIIAGERRWRAARFLKLEHVPVVIKKVNPQQMLEMAMVENLQRKDLNPLERAKAFIRLKEEFGLDNKQVSKKNIQKCSIYHKQPPPLGSSRHTKRWLTFRTYYRRTRQSPWQYKRY